MIRDEKLLDKRKAAHVMDKVMIFVSPQQPATTECGMRVSHIENKEKRFPIIMCLDISGGKRCSLNQCMTNQLFAAHLSVPDMKS